MVQNARVAPGRGTQIELDRLAPGASKWYRCSRCVIEYTSAKTTPPCPLCALEIKYEQVRDALQSATNSIEHLEQQWRQEKVQTDLYTAIKDASDLLDDGDRAFIKTVLYQYRQDRGVALRPIHGTTGHAIGFMAEWRNRDPEARECTSIGGRALAGYFEEAQRAHGSAQGLQLLIRACQHLLPGGM